MNRLDLDRYAHWFELRYPRLSMAMSVMREAGIHSADIERTIARHCNRYSINPLAVVGARAYLWANSGRRTVSPRLN